jgi:hypothetical protein
VNGPIEIWEKVESGEISLHPNDSRQEYDHIMAMLSRPDLRNIWSYKLVECIPQQTNQPGVYSTLKKPMMELYAYGPVKEEEVSKKFDEQGQPIANPITTRLQIGEFHWNGKVEGREFQSTVFGGGSKGLAVDEGEMSLESTFLQRQIERRLDPNSKSIPGPLMEMLEVVIAEKTISPLLKAYLHREIVELMKNKPAAWGVALSNQLLTDYENLVNLVKIKIRPTDWMDKKLNAELSAKLSAFYNQIGVRDYFTEAKFTLGILQSLQKADFSYVGHADLQGGARYIGGKPSISWGLSNQKGKFIITKSTGSGLVPYSPLIETNPQLEEILADGYAKSSLAKDSFGTVGNFLPLDFSN